MFCCCWGLFCCWGWSCWVLLERGLAVVEGGEVLRGVVVAVVPLGEVTCGVGGGVAESSLVRERERTAAIERPVMLWGGNGGGG